MRFIAMIAVPLEGTDLTAVKAQADHMLGLCNSVNGALNEASLLYVEVKSDEEIHNMHSDGVSNRPFGARDLGAGPVPVYVISRRDGDTGEAQGHLNGPNPVLEEMLSFDPGDINDVIIRFNNDETSTQDIVRETYQDGEGHFSWIEPKADPPGKYDDVPF